MEVHYRPAMFDQNGQRALQMCQLKCGEISMTIWGTARSELEDMYLVRFPLSQEIARMTVD